MDEPVLSAEQVTAIIDAMRDRAIIDTEKALLAFSYEDLTAIRRDLEERRDAILAACTGAEGEPDPLDELESLIRIGRADRPGSEFREVQRLLARLREACQQALGEEHPDAR